MHTARAPSAQLDPQARIPIRNPYNRLAVALLEWRTMATEPTNLADKPLEQLLEELTDARLEKREADIARLQDEICKHQARGERPCEAPPSNAPKKAI